MTGSALSRTPVEPDATPEPAERVPDAGAGTLSPRLYNRDLAPTRTTGRRWGGYNIFTLWASDVHSLGNYGFVLGLFALGRGPGRSWSRWASARRCCS
ncbi:MAG: hypothetical protein L0I76_28410 [Pseudonocardia sp.]|nr:hypothetical protein [Pseudonocardia sp.]